MNPLRQALYSFVGVGLSDPRLAKVNCKTGVAAAKTRMIAHRVLDIAAIREGRSIRFGARWLCGGGTVDAVVIADPSTAGAVCERCAELHAEGTTVVYRCFDAGGRLLYVGSTCNGASTRLAFHERNASWWPAVANVEIERLDSLPAARAAERRAIRLESPVHNVAGRRKDAAFPSDVRTPTTLNGPVVRNRIAQLDATLAEIAELLGIAEGTLRNATRTRRPDPLKLRRAYTLLAVLNRPGYEPLEIGDILANEAAAS